MFWLVVLIIAAVIAATFAAYVLWGLDWPPRDPPLRAGPVIVAADPLSAHAIRLAIERGDVGPVEVELERTILPDAPTLSLITLYGRRLSGITSFWGLFSLEKNRKRADQS